MHIVGKVVHQQAVGLELIGAGHLATGRADAGHGGPHAGPGAAQVPAVVIDLVEEVLGVFGIGADEHDVAGLAMEGHETGAELLPAIRQLAQHAGGIVVTRRRLHAQGMEFLGLGEGRPDLGEPGNDAAAVAVHRNGATLPIPLAGLVGVLQLTQQAVGHLVDALLRVLVAQTLDTGNETRPGAGFQLIEHRCFVFIDGHCAVSPGRQ